MNPEKKFETSSIDDIKALFENRTEEDIIPPDSFGKSEKQVVTKEAVQSAVRKTASESIKKRKRNRTIANIMIYSGIGLLIVACAVLVAVIFNGNNGSSIKSLDITNSGEITLRVGHSQQIKVKTEPADTEYALSYVSGDTSVATVSLDGKVTAVKNGKTEITVSSGELSDTITVNVKKDIIESLDVSLAALSLDGGEEQKIDAKLTPADAKDVKLSWKSADTDVATVDKNGVVKGVNTGETTITLTDSVTGLSKDITVTVNGLELPESMKFDKDSVTVEVGDVYNSVLKFTPEDITYTGAIYYTSDSSVASVTNEGVITAKSAGNCTIEAYYENDYRLVASMEVTVIDPFPITSQETTAPETPSPETTTPDTEPEPEPETDPPASSTPAPAPEYSGSHKMEVIDGITYFDGVMIAKKPTPFPQAIIRAFSPRRWTHSTICKQLRRQTAFHSGYFRASVRTRIRMLSITVMWRKTEEMPQIHIRHARVIPITRQDIRSTLTLSNRTSSTTPQDSGLTKTVISTVLSFATRREKKAPQAICMSRGT